VQPADVWIGNPDLTASEIVAWVQEAQMAVASAYDWSTLATGVVSTLPPPIGSDNHIRVTIGNDVSRIIPNSVLIDNRPVYGPLTSAEWLNASTGATRFPKPAYTLQHGSILFTGATAGAQLVYGYIQECIDFANDQQETVLGAGVPEFVRMFENCILYAALAAYRDSKGLPAGTAAAQAMATLADARGRDQPVGALTLVQRRHHHRHGGISITGPITTGLDHALLDDLQPDDDPISDDLP